MATKYDRIAADLRRQVQSGTLKPGAQLPPETALMAHYKVSLPTMRAALAQLRAEGLIDSQHGRGTFVKEPRQRVRFSNQRYQWEKDRVHAPEDERRRTGATEYDTGLSLDDLEFATEYRTSEADEGLAEVFGVPVGTKLVQRVYATRTRREDVPLSISNSYLVYEQVKANPALLDARNEPWPGGTLAQLATVGIEVARIVDEVTARPAQVDEAESLGIGAGVAVLVRRKIMYDTAGRVVEVADVVMPGDRHVLVYDTPLTPWESR